MSIKTIIFLDDERCIKDVTWINYNLTDAVVHTARTYDEFTQIVNVFLVDDKVPLSEILFSFDHDIQDFKDGVERTGKHCAEYLCVTTLNMKLNTDDLNCVVHSMNPVGRKNIVCYVEQFKEHFRSKD